VLTAACWRPALRRGQIASTRASLGDGLCADSYGLPQPPVGRFDFSRVQRYLPCDAAAAPTAVVLYLPGTHMSAYLPEDEIRFLVAGGVHVWSMSYRSANLPTDAIQQDSVWNPWPTSPEDLAKIGTWTTEVFAGDAARVASFVRIEDPGPLYVAGFSFGASLAYRLAAMGVLGDRSALAHGVWLRDADVDLLARTRATVVHNCSSNLRLATGVAPLRRLLASGVSVALGLDDMGLADDDDMFAEVRLAHVLQRVHGQPQDRRLLPAEAFGLAWDGGARVVGAATTIGRLERGRRGDVVVLDLDALSAPFAVGEVDVWELLLGRAKAAHVESVIVEGRPLMLERRLQHIDRQALMDEVAGAAASAIARRDPAHGTQIDELRRRIVEHYQEQRWSGD